MKKRIVALLLALCMVAGSAQPVYAATVSSGQVQDDIQMVDEDVEDVEAEEEAEYIETSDIADSSETEETDSEAVEVLEITEDANGDYDEQVMMLGDEVETLAETEEEEEDGLSSEEEELSPEEYEALNDPLYQKYMYGTSLLTSDYYSASDLTHDSRFDKYVKVQGIDVSKYQGDINWTSVKSSGISFAMIRLGYRGMQQGTLQLDSYFAQNMEGAHAAGVQIGIYFFTQAVTVAEAQEEARYVISQLSQYPGYVSYPVIIDIETLAGSRLDNAGLSVDEKTAICNAFCSTIQEAGYTAGIYSSKSYLESQLHADVLDDNYYIWMAHYVSQTSYAGDYSMWQYTSAGSVNGINGYVDMDIAYLSTTPGTPSGLMQTAATTTSVTLSWDLVTNADGYQVRCYDSSGTQIQVCKVSSATATFDNLTEGTKYTYRVRAFYLNADGTYTYGAYSSYYTVYTTPGQVQNLNVSASTDSTVTLSWKKLSNVSGYRILKYDDATGTYVVVATTTNTSNTYTVTGLESGTRYRFKVRGYVNLNGTTRNFGANSTAVSTYTSPAQVTGVKSTGVTVNSVSLSWDKQSGVTGYRVYCYDESGNLLGSQYSTSNSLQYTGLSSGMKYQFRVRSYLKVDGTKIWGKLSSAVSVKAKPTQVTNMSVSSANTNTIIVNWSAVTGAEGYCVCLYDESTAQYTVLGTTTKTTYTVSGLNAGTEYSIRVAAYVRNGSKTVFGKYSASLNAATKPVAVANVKQTSQTTDSITISWGAQTGVTGYRVYCYDINGNLLKYENTTNNSYTATELDAGKYIFKVRAYVKAEDYTAWGKYSSELETYTKPGKVTGLYASSSSENRIKVKWTAVAGADGYCVCLYDESTKEYTILGTTTSCAYNIKNLESNTEYNIRVVAYVQCNGKVKLGNYSKSLVATTE